MADIELLIKISEEEYRLIKKSDKNVFADVASKECMLYAIKNGTLLSKGHGRLIDVDDLDITTITTDDYSGNEVLDVVLKEDIDDAPTIIEADKESEDKK